MDLLKMGVSEEEINNPGGNRRRSITKRHTSLSLGSPRNFQAARRLSKVIPLPPGVTVPAAGEMKEIKISFGGGFGNALESIKEAPEQKKKGGIDVSKLFNI